MTVVFVLLSLQAILGAFDNLWHHEWQARLPDTVSARYELLLHAVREAIYGIVFLSLAWSRWEGGLAYLFAALLLAEIVITLADFLEEDRSRPLPPFERVLHTMLALFYGAFLAVLAPVLAIWAARSSGIVFDGHGWVSWLLTAFAAGVLAWSLRNGLAVVRLFRLAREAASGDAARPVSGPAILVTGGTGFIGQVLVRRLLAEGARVIVLTRNPRRAAARLGQRVCVVGSLDEVPSETPVVAAVNLAGASIVGGRWTARRRALLIGSRVGVTRELGRLFARLETRPKVLVSASAVGFYGPRDGAEVLDEAAGPLPGSFQSDLCVAWEEEARTAAASGTRVVMLRLGLVLGRTGGLFPPLALAARLGAGAVIGRGTQPVPWVHVDDAVGLIQFAIENPGLEGAVNAVAPECLPQSSFIRTVAATFGRPVWLRIPARALTWLAGEAAELVLEGQVAAAKKALRAGYEFRWPSLRAAAEGLARRQEGNIRFHEPAMTV